MRPDPAWLDQTAYPFRSRHLSLSAGEMHYVDEGQGDAILLVHGTPTWSFEFRHLIAALSTRHRCVAPDHFGFGLSGRPRAFAYTPEAHAAALGEFVDRLGLDRFTLVVHDFGGPIGLPLALRPQAPVRRLVILNAFAWLLGGAVGQSREFYQALLDGLPSLREVPTLFVSAMKDNPFQPYQLARWQALLPHAETVALEHAGHWPHEEEAKRVIAAVEQFLQRA